MALGSNIELRSRAARSTEESVNEKRIAAEAAIDHIISRAARCARSAVGGMDSVGSTKAIRTPIVRSAMSAISLVNVSEWRILVENIGRKDLSSRSKKRLCCSRMEFLEIVALGARFCAFER